MIIEEQVGKAIEAIDQRNSADPNTVEWGGESGPKELLYSRKMTYFLNELTRAPSAVARLAVRAQHLARWEIPRSDYPMTREGYLTWRKRLGKYHAEECAKILQTLRLPEEFIAKVEAVLRKEGLNSNPDTQLMEDCACLVFLDADFEVFRLKHAHDKLIRIVQKTWGKMSDRSREYALTMEHTEEALKILKEALAG